MSLAGALIGFDVAPEHRATITSALDFAGGVSGEDAAMWYREVPHGDGRRFVRDDPVRDPGPVPIGRSVERVLEDVHLSIALHARDEVFVHAGVVGWKGRAVVLPGRSGAGKSTLVEALVRAGATYCSDEYARVRADGMIVPFPRPIRLRTGAGRRELDPRTIGLVGTEVLPPSLVLFTRYTDGAALVPEEVPPATAALELFDHIVVAELSPGRATAAAAQVARQTTAVRTLRPDAVETAPFVLDLAERVEVAA